jgi:Tol biopolymer transport system component
MRWYGLLALIALALVPASAAASFPGQNGRIVFSQEIPETGNPYDAALRTVNPDGSDIQTLGTGLAPSYSPDGQSIVYAERLDGDRGRYAIGVIPAEGGPTTWLTSSSDYPTPEFSPDGDEIVYATANGLRGIHVDGTRNRKILRGASCCIDPTYSPDGSRIAFSGTPPGQGRASGIWTVRPDGSRPRRLTKQKTAIGDSEPSYSPDGSTIAFQRRRGEKGLAVMRANGKGERTLPDTFFAFGPVFAPTGDLFAGRSVAFTLSKEACGSAVVLEASGVVRNGLASGNFGSTCVTAVSWQPLPAL